MTPRKLLRIASLLCVLGLVAGRESRAVAEIPALKVVPDNAWGLIIVNNLSQLDEKVSKLAQAAQLPIPPGLWAMAKEHLGVKDGLDEKGTVVFAMLPGDHEPVPLIVVPVTDYEKFIAQLQPEPAGDNISKVKLGPGHSMVAKKGNYALITEASAADTSAFKAVLSAKADISAELASAATWITEQDVAAIATTAGIKAATGPARQGLQNAKKSFPPDNPQFGSVAAAFDMYDNMLKACEEDVTQAGIGLKLDKDSNIHVTSHWGFKVGGTLAKGLGGIKKLPQKAFADLPAGPFVVAATGVIPRNMLDWYMPMVRMSPQFSAMPEEQMKKIEATMSEFLKGMESVSLVWGVPRDKQPWMSNFTAVLRVDNARKYLDMLAAKMPELKKLYQAAKVPGADGYDLKPIDIGGAKALQFTMDLGATLPPGLPPGSDEKIKELFTAMFGADGKMSVTYVAADDKTILEMLASGDEVKKKLADYKNRSSSLSNDVITAKTLALLPADAQWVGVWDVGGTLSTVKQIMAAVAPDGPAAMIPALSGLPPIGFSATASAQNVDTDLVLPVDTVKGVAGKVQEAMLGGPPGGR